MDFKQASRSKPPCSTDGLKKPHLGKLLCRKAKGSETRIAKWKAFLGLIVYSFLPFASLVVLLTITEFSWWSICVLSIAIYVGVMIWLAFPLTETLGINWLMFAFVFFAAAIVSKLPITSLGFQVTTGALILATTDGIYRLLGIRTCTTPSSGSNKSKGAALFRVIPGFVIGSVVAVAVMVKLLSM